MILSRMRNLIISFAALLAAILLLASCGGSNTPSVQTKPTPTPSPTSGQGQRILDTMANKLNSANTLHGIFDLTLNGQTVSGNTNTEVWNAKPSKSHTVVLQSSISQLTTGTVNVTDGKQQWQYDPAQKVVYTGPVIAPTPGTPISGQGGVSGGQGNQSLFLLNIVQSVFTQSDGTLKSSSATVNGHNVYDIHVVPSTSSTSTPANFSYTGEVYIDKTTQQPVQVKLDIQGLGNIILNIPMLALNQPIPASTFTFVAPPGVKVLPFSQLSATPGSGTGTLTLVQAQQQAGYHLLSIPASQTDYTLNGVNALGAPGNQIYTLNYMKGNIAITIAEGKPLANLPATGQQVSLRGTNATVTSAGGTTTLVWTEKGVGIRITSSLSSDQVESIAKSLA